MSVRRGVKVDCVQLSETGEPLRWDWPTRREFLHVMWPVSATKTSPPASIVAPPGPISNLARGAQPCSASCEGGWGDRIGMGQGNAPALSCHPNILRGTGNRCSGAAAQGSPAWRCVALLGYLPGAQNRPGSANGLDNGLTGSIPVIAHQLRCSSKIVSETSIGPHGPNMGQSI